MRSPSPSSAALQITVRASYLVSFDSSDGLFVLVMSAVYEPDEGPHLERQTFAIKGKADTVNVRISYRRNFADYVGVNNYNKFVLSFRIFLYLGH